MAHACGLGRRTARESHRRIYARRTWRPDRTIVAFLRASIPCRSGCAGCTARRHGSRSRTPAQWRRNRTAIHHCARCSRRRPRTASESQGPPRHTDAAHLGTAYRPESVPRWSYRRARSRAGTLRTPPARPAPGGCTLDPPPSRSGAAMRRTSGRPPSSTGRECSRARHVQ